MGNRVRADHAGALAQLGPWKVLTSLPQGSLLVSASNSLWIAITRFGSVSHFFLSSFCGMLDVLCQCLFRLVYANYQAEFNAHLCILGVGVSSLCG